MSPDDSGSSSSDSKTPTPLHGGRESYFEDINQVSPSSKSQCISIPSSPASPGTATLRPRRSSLSLGLDQLRHAGGVNSIDAFARSWTRAAGYFEITPSRQSYVSVSDFGDDDDAEHEESSILDDEVEPVPAEYTGYQPPTTYGSYGSIPSLHRGSYGSISSLPRGAMPSEGLSNSVVRHAEELFAEQQRAMMDPEAVDKEHEPLLVKTVATEEGIQQVIVGQSTLPQTVFNSVNVLIGVGLLGLPLGLKYSGWLIGMLFLAFSAVITNYTAKLLARCLERSPNQSLVTYSDIAFLAFGHKSRVAVSILFSLELVAACVALVVLFADSLNSLIPSISVTGWKIIAGIILTPLSFVPLQVLSFSSILGIFSTVSIFLIVLINGLIKRNYPGSLLDPAPQYLFPQSWYTLPISFGLLMSPWGGHSVFPNIFRDMRHPHKYNRAVNITYWFTYLLDASMMVVGILMFGDGVMDEITQNLLELTEYPESTKLAMVIFVAIIPLTKTPLNARPIISTLEVLLGVDARAIAYQPGVVGMTSTTRSIFRIGIRVLVNATFVGIAIIFPAFDRIMAFLGSALCFSICVILPLLFYLKIFGNEVSKREKTFDWILVVICSILAVIGTAFTFIPQESFQ